MSCPDNRGSWRQKLLYEMTLSIYGKRCTVEWEKLIPDLDLRFDIFVLELGIALELHGDQHYEYVEHFHNDFNGFIHSKKRDAKKKKWALDNGIKFVELSELEFDNLSGPLSLKCYINSIPFPPNPYTTEVFSIKKNPILLKVKEMRAKNYISIKNKK